MAILSANGVRAFGPAILALVVGLIAAVTLAYDVIRSGRFVGGWTALAVASLAAAVLSGMTAGYRARLAAAIISGLVALLSAGVAVVALRFHSGPLLLVRGERFLLFGGTSTTAAIAILIAVLSSAGAVLGVIGRRSGES